jgi:hypothetical protein
MSFFFKQAKRKYIYIKPRKQVDFLAQSVSRSTIKVCKNFQKTAETCLIVKFLSL